MARVLRREFRGQPTISRRRRSPLVQNNRVLRQNIAFHK
jgi:hypothetical protein